MPPFGDEHKDVAPNKTFRGTRWANDNRHCGMCDPSVAHLKSHFYASSSSSSSSNKYTTPLGAVTSHCRKTTVPQCHETRIALTGQFGKPCRILPQLCRNTSVVHVSTAAK
ncbi:hypothetical protein Tc00.1047053504393.10 [Trypanosoma cruzi]|uniref:Uncharacterized protein n=1 Tax=Trypanosoma cruzi (strain CL Brener) TaxID=353153 RepID=Q4CRM2_TRYCC|nr:uncharacterized protein Tc00.1047053504393.10 [Trypanosoma cruzi]EAN82923.1 hypothetical protein Tc00.1047053504393.10 [Trypanosoma cruzi]|eukprot:XP_804774.1 hypothetical protein Tc00.1047053504393.10 [Trypanosoma cruzi strain CL Brener]